MIVKIFNRVEECALAFIVFLLGLTIVIQVILRAIGIGGVFFWVEETARHVLIFITFLGASLAVKYRVHFRMSALETSLPKAGQYILQMVTNLGCSLCFGYVVYQGFTHVINLAKSGVTTASLTIPFFIPYLAIPFFSVFISLRFFLAALEAGRDYKGLRSSKSNSGGTSGS